MKLLLAFPCPALQPVLSTASGKDTLGKAAARDVAHSSNVSRNHFNCSPHQPSLCEDYVFVQQSVQEA
ncbi:hypothetical protein E2C01_038446 [Portunus trituberculatus]|uniref:Uncharacterized protein n=1 Tax=Portunus trituberculatus TaxID=210409 RepID=A0A5B7FH96_PORTR|nr:hypothetical protein [Portunus trituberculatus]